MSDTLSFINLTDASLVSEDELLDRAREGDRSAFGTLYLRHRDAARKVAGMCASSPPCPGWPGARSPSGPTS